MVWDHSSLWVSETIESENKDKGGLPQWILRWTEVTKIGDQEQGAGLGGHYKRPGEKLCKLHKEVETTILEISWNWK